MTVAVTVCIAIQYSIIQRNTSCVHPPSASQLVTAEILSGNVAKVLRTYVQCQTKDKHSVDTKHRNA